MVMGNLEGHVHVSLFSIEKDFRGRIQWLLLK